MAMMFINLSEVLFNIWQMFVVIYGLYDNIACLLSISPEVQESQTPWNHDIDMSCNCDVDILGFLSMAETTFEYSPTRIITQWVFEQEKEQSN
jgi:hypothetical protein